MSLLILHIDIMVSYFSVAFIAVTISHRHLRHLKYDDTEMPTFKNQMRVKLEFSEPASQSL